MGATDWYTDCLRTETPRSIRRILTTCQDAGNRAWARDWYLDRGLLTQEEARELRRLDALRSALGGMTK